MANLIIKRDKGYTDCLRNYNILLNGKSIGHIKQGDEINLSLNQGIYEIRAKIDWCKTKKINFKISDDNDNKSFLVYSNLRGIKTIFSFFYSILGLFKEDSWMKIKAI